LEYKKNPLIKDRVIKEMRNKYGHYSSINTDTVREDTDMNRIATQKQKRKIKPYSFQPIPDSRLFDLANQYLTTDESLERFQNEQRVRGEDILSTTQDKIKEEVKTKSKRASRDLDY
jgi:hypothetical protein